MPYPLHTHTRGLPKVGVDPQCHLKGSWRMGGAIGVLIPHLLCDPGRPLDLSEPQFPFPWNEENQLHGVGWLRRGQGNRLSLMPANGTLSAPSSSWPPRAVGSSPSTGSSSHPLPQTSRRDLSPACPPVSLCVRPGARALLSPSPHSVPSGAPFPGDRQTDKRQTRNHMTWRSEKCCEDT